MIVIPFFTTAVGAMPQAERTDATSNKTYNITSYHYQNYSYPKSNVTGQDIKEIYGNFNSNSDISFFICNSTIFEEWNEKWNSTENVSLSEVYNYQLAVSSYSWAFRIPYNETWQIVFYNNGSKIISLTASFSIHSTPPIVTLIGVYENETMSGTVTLQANAASTYFNITSMEIFIDGFLLATSTSNHISYTWDTTKRNNGWHYIDVAAEDQSGLIGGYIVTIVVSNSSPVELTPFLIVGGIVAVMAIIAILASSSSKKRRKRLHRKYLSTRTQTFFGSSTRHLSLFNFYLSK
jgi:hypothetical protein